MPPRRRRGVRLLNFLKNNFALSIFQDLIIFFLVRKFQEGLRRLDAAFSALSPMGFAKTLVRKTVNSLLKVSQNDAFNLFTCRERNA